MAPIITPVDFSATQLSQYIGFYATILDNVFTHEECQSLLTLATQSAPWTPAGLSAEGPTQTVHSDFRNNERIIYVNSEASGMIYERLRPLVEGDIGEIKVGGQWSGITGKPGRKQGPTWKLTGINPRLSFLRYGAGHYFKPHCDGLNDIVHDDGVVIKSFVTLQIYLNGHEGEDLANDTATVTALKLTNDDSDEPLRGGSTRFWTPDKKHFLDVLPRTGRVLVFQQRMLIHSGELVEQGTKYTMRSDFMFEQRT